MDLKIKLASTVWEKNSSSLQKASLAIFDSNGNNLLTAGSQGHAFQQSDVLAIKTFLEGKRSQSFVTKLNNCDYFCLINGSGLFVAHNRFNTNADNDIATKRVAGFDRHATDIVAACKIGSLVFVAIGCSGEGKSVVSVLNEILSISFH